MENVSGLRSNTEVKRDQLSKFKGAMAFSAVGDALGWPTELGKYPGIVIKRFGKHYLENFIEWDKTVGGRFWGYRETIKEGSYSDDTQLSLSVARCISENGGFDADKFAYFELPLWLAYERGGGKSVKTAARTILQSKRDWELNFYRRGSTEYRNAGANGAAMRTLPLALVHSGNPDNLYRDAFLNSIVTHGHPRAILGAMVHAAAIAFALNHNSLDKEIFCEYLRDVIERSSLSLKQYDWVHKWIEEWDRRPLRGLSFREHFQNTRKEARSFLDGISEYLNSSDDSYYKFTGAFDQRLKGSGLSTVFVSLYLFIKYSAEPEMAVLKAVNMLGSDTDTIATFVGGLYGALYGLECIPERFLEGIQDKDYIIRLGEQLYNFCMGNLSRVSLPAAGFNRRDYFMRILAWEMGLHEMFWDALNEGDIVVHPALGRGKIIQKFKRPILKKGYQVKLVEVSFDCGQTCTFHSRVAPDSRLSECLCADLEKATIL